MEFLLLLLLLLFRISNPMPSPSIPGGSMCFCQCFLPQLTDPHFRASGTRAPPLRHFAVYTLHRDRGVDMRAVGLAGIYGTSCGLLLRMRQ
jgi:hypothetical protein